jgi:hypothetical protein
MNRKGCEKAVVICPGETEENHEYLTKDRPMSRVLNRGPYENEAGMPTTEPQLLIRNNFDSIYPFNI